MKIGKLLHPLLKKPDVTVAFAMLLIATTIAVLVPYLAPFRPDEINLRGRLQPPILFGGTLKHPLGTDALGRDVMSRVLYGTRVSISIGFAVVLVSGTVGTILGLLAGYFRGWIDRVLSRLMEIQLALPTIVLAIAIMAFLGPGLINLMIVLSIANWVDYARIVRAESLSLREREFVEGARGIGAGHFRIISRYVLPNALAPTIVIATFSVASTIIAEASLSFLGLGVPPDVPSWGAMLAEGREYLGNAWWLGTLPGVAIATVVLSINVLGDWLRDWLDPRG